MRRLLAVLALAALSVPGGAADEERKTVRPSVPPPDSTPRTVPADRSGPSAGDSAGAGALKGIRATATRAGEASVVVQGAARTLRVGDRVGTDVVTAIDAGRISLTRPAGTEAGGEAMVVVTFDAQGRGRVRIYWQHDPTVRVPPPVR